MHLQFTRVTAAVQHGQRLRAFLDPIDDVELPLQRPFSQPLAQFCPSSVKVRSVIEAVPLRVRSRPQKEEQCLHQEALHCSPLRDEGSMVHQPLGLLVCGGMSENDEALPEYSYAL